MSFTLDFNIKGIRFYSFEIKTINSLNDSHTEGCSSLTGQRVHVHGTVAIKPTQDDKLCLKFPTAAQFPIRPRSKG